MASPSLTILIPCLNEELGVADVVRENAAAFPQAEILVVDNGSEDSTAATAKAAGATVITEKRRGKARAVATIDTDLILMVDGDGSYPDEGAQFLVEEYLREPVDMVTGIRSAQNASHIFRPMLQWGMSIFASVLNFVFGFKPLDLFSGLRLFSRRFYQHVPVLTRGFELEIELTIQAVDKGFSMTEIPARSLVSPANRGSTFCFRTSSTKWAVGTKRARRWRKYRVFAAWRIPAKPRIDFAHVTARRLTSPFDPIASAALGRANLPR